MTDPSVDVIVWDSGQWGDVFSLHRLLPTLKMLELTSGGNLRISEMRYVETPSELSTRLPNEPQEAYDIREDKWKKIQSARVQRTSDFFSYTFRDENDLERLHPIPDPGGKDQLFIVIMPPGKERTRLVTSLLRLDTPATLLIAPGVFTDTIELELLIAEGQHHSTTRVVPFTPYRYSTAMLRLRDLKKAENKPIQIIDASVLAGRYPHFGRIGFSALISEFAAPVLDCTLEAAGSGIETGSIIYKETERRCPCILVNALHENRVASSIHISGISNFQQMNLNFTAFFSGSRLCFSDAFRDTVFYDSDDIRITESSRGHDAKIEARNGYAALLSNIINHHEDLPTLASYRNTQRFIDRIFASLTQMQKTSQAHLTF